MSGSKLRILLIIDSYPPVLGGSEIEAQRVSAGMIRRGHQVEVLCADATEMPRVRHWVDPEGVPVTILARNSRGIWKDRRFAIEAVWEAWRRRNQYDVVYFLMQGLQVATGLPVSRWLGKPAVMKIAGSGVIPLMRSTRFGRKELDWLKEWKVPLLLLNDGMFEEALSDGFPRDQLTWMPNPVDVDIFRPSSAEERKAWRQTHNIPANARVAIYVGRLAPEKGLQPLLRGFAVAARQEPEAVLVLVGDGPTRGELESLSRELGISGEQILFAGRAPISEVPRWLGASDIFALTSPSEGFPCALVEAMAVGLPSVVSAIPANLQLVEDEVHGLAVPWNEAEAIGAAILRMCAAPSMRSGMGRCARERAIANYSMDAVLQLYEKMFSRAMKAKA